MGARKHPLGALSKYFPGVSLLTSYRARWLPRDLFAALGVSAMLVAQGMAFAYLVGVPPSLGLWAGIASLLGYAAFGPSRQLNVGPEAGTAILTLAVISPLGVGGAEHLALPALLALGTGGLLLILGFFRLGALADFLSQPLLVGYLNGMAFVILASQLGDITGTTIEAQGFFSQLREFFGKIDSIHGPTTALSLATITVVVVCRLLSPRFPGTVLAVVLATLLSFLLGWEDEIALVGAIDTSLPQLGLPPFPDVE